MTDLERELFMRLITAAWPFSWQVVFALATVIGYFIWSRLYFRVVDPIIRARVGHALGVQIIWVLRHSADYQTAFESGFERYYHWSWGIQAEQQRTLLRDGAVAMLGFLIVSILAGLSPVAVFLFATLGFKVLSAVLFIPACVATLAIYGIFWCGRYEVTGMRQAARNVA
jgi:hypothetical protein